MKMIRELGSLPSDAFDKYQKTPLKTVSNIYVVVKKEIGSKFSNQFNFDYFFVIHHLKQREIKSNWFKTTYIISCQ